MNRFLCSILRPVAVALASCAVLALAQGPPSNPDHPPGNVNELTLAGIRPGRVRIAAEVRRFGTQWFHPSPDEPDIYIWQDLKNGLRLTLEVDDKGVVRAVTVLRADALPNDGLPPTLRRTNLPRAHLPLSIASTGRGMRLGDSPIRLLHIYGKPFFRGSAQLDRQQVEMIVFNFSWAGRQYPQILESSFDSHHHLIKMTLSADYY